MQDNFLFGQTGTAAHRAILRTASLCSVTLLMLIGIFGLAAGLVALLANREKAQDDLRLHRMPLVRMSIGSLLLLAAVLGFLLTASSAPLWQFVPELRYLQFPWRLNAVLGCVAAAMLGLALARVKMRFSLAVALALAAPMLLSLWGNRQYRQACNRGNDVASVVADFYRGNKFDPTDSYTPVGADAFAIGHANPNAWVAASPNGTAPAGAARNYSVALHDRLHFEISSAEAAFFVINLRAYPAWTITLDGAAVADRPHRPDGLIVVPIPKGQSTIDIAYALTWDRIAGWILSALALCALGLVWRSERQKPQTSGGISTPI